MTDHALSQQSPTTNHADVVERYIASWNETDPARRLTLIAETFTPDTRYVDPLMQGGGFDGLDAMVRAVQTQFPAFRFSLSRPVETVGDHVRFSWQLGPVGMPGVVEGTDFARVAADGRLAEIHGFLDRVPESSA